jgi:hypothetical protein
LLSFFVAPVAARLSADRVPIRFLLGVGLATVGLGLALMHGVEPGSSWTHLLPGFLVAGAGIGITNPGIGQAAIAVVPAAKAGMGSGINTTFRQVGIATGVAGLGAIFQSHVQSKLHSGKLGELVSATGIPPNASPRFARQAADAFTSGMNEILMIAAVIAFVGAALGLALTRSKDFVPQGPQQAEAETAPVPA